jgi:DNA-binding transcriptional ArsR family regulator
MSMTHERAFHALADPTRRAIFERLRHGPLTVGRIARGLPVSRPAVSQHLRVLEEAGLVSPRAEGTRRFYRIETKGLEDLRRYLERFWDDVLDAFRNEAERGTKPRPTAGGAAVPRRTRRKPHVER